MRTTLVVLGIIFLPMAIWFFWKTYWGSAIAVLVLSAGSLRLGLTRDADSWMSMIDELGAPSHKPEEK
ncbi:MAG TPA: hypothetical protein VII52_04165 [Gemmatimonadaceae bacterium]